LGISDWLAARQDKSDFETQIRAAQGQWERVRGILEAHGMDIESLDEDEYVFTAKWIDYGMDPSKALSVAREAINDPDGDPDEAVARAFLEEKGIDPDRLDDEEYAKEAWRRTLLGAHRDESGSADQH
jgi:hypothetical protein